MKDEEIKRETGEPGESNAMKVIRGTGQSIEAEPLETEIKKAGKLENFWYHHKWHAGITIGFIIIGIVLAVQLITHKTPDVYIMYAGPGAMVGNQYERLEQAILAAMDDYDSNGYKAISFTDNTYLNKEQLEARRKMGLNVDEAGNIAAYQRYKMEIAAGEHMFCMLDPELYRDIAALEGFVPLEEIFGEVPKGAVDEYGVRLGDIDFYESNPDISFIPADTILAVRVTSPVNLKIEEKSREYSERHRQLFRDIVLFEAEEE